MSTSSTSYQTSFEDQAGEPAMPAWKVELTAKLAAHRQRRPAALEDRRDGNREQERASGGAAERPSGSSARTSLGAASVAARVAERYAKAPSYSEYLAASAAAAKAAAETAAFAAMQAQESAEVLARLTAAEQAWQSEIAQSAAAELISSSQAPSQQKPGPALAGASWPTVEHPEPLPVRGIVPPRSSGSFAGAGGAGRSAGGIVDAFAEATVPAVVSLPAKLIEFPRELIAAHKSRPRIAEGPLADEESSLRIFEVAGEVTGEVAGKVAGETPGAAIPGVQVQLTFEERGATERGRDAGTPRAGAISAANPDARGENAGSGSEVYRRDSPGRRGRSAVDGLASKEPDSGAPEWQPIHLGEHPAPEPAAGQLAASGQATGEPGLTMLHTASLADRTMSALVDGAVVGGAFLLFVLVFTLCTTHPPVNKTAMGCAAAVLVVLFLFYEWLFLSYGGGTLGMRYARIALCTFDDGNPDRAMRRRRLVASVLSALPLGLGFLWALFDEDSLGWHDRMTRSYQRSYR